MQTKNDICLISHFDLDGVGCAIFTKKLYDVSESKAQGYPKIRQNLDKLATNHSDTIVFADLRVEPQDLKFALEHWKKVIYFDHHLQSEQYAAIPQGERFEFHYSEEKCATRLVFEEWMKQGGRPTKEEANFAMLVDIYDLWRDENPLFDKAFALNDMFWELNFWNFERRMQNGFLDFTSEEKSVLYNLKASRIKTIEDAPKQELGGGGIVLMIEDKEALNYVVRCDLLKEYDAFFILYSIDGVLSLSVRVRKDTPYNVDMAIQEMIKEKVPFVTGGGGHEKAGGIIIDTEDPFYSIDRLLRTIGTQMYPILIEDEIPF